MRTFLFLLVFLAGSAFAHQGDHGYPVQGTSNQGSPSVVRQTTDNRSLSKQGSSTHAEAQKSNVADKNNENWVCVKTPAGKTNCLAMPKHED